MSSVRKLRIANHSNTGSLTTSLANIFVTSINGLAPGADRLNGAPKSKTWAGKGYVVAL